MKEAFFLFFRQLYFDCFFVKMRKLVVMIRKLSIVGGILILCAGFLQTSKAQSPVPVVADNPEISTSLVRWYTVDEAADAMNGEGRKIILELYTDWCGWCKRMEGITLQQPHIAQYLNENFYPIRFNAESKQAINFKDKSYEFVAPPGTTGYHEFVAQFMEDGRLSFPTIVFLDEDLNVIQSMVGFKTPYEFEQIITYFATDHYKKMPWQKYRRFYRSILESSRE